jgi:cytochrome P450
MYDMHQKYGDFVRYAPNRIIVNTTAALKDIHAHGKNFRKAASYSSFIAQEDSHSTHSVIDPVDHRRKRRLISQGLGDVALRDSEPSIVETIDRFVGSLAKIDSASGEMFKDPATSEKWGPPKNMADSCNFLTFDVNSSYISYGLIQLTRYAGFQ